jgi:hypothetical protein
LKMWDYTACSVVEAFFFCEIDSWLAVLGGSRPVPPCGGGALAASAAETADYACGDAATVPLHAAKWPPLA